MPSALAMLYLLPLIGLLTSLFVFFFALENPVCLKEDFHTLVLVQICSDILSVWHLDISDTSMP